MQGFEVQTCINGTTVMTQAYQVGCTRILLKWIVKREDGILSREFLCSGQEKVMGFCECSNKPSFYTSCDEFLDCVKSSQAESALLSYIVSRSLSQLRAVSRGQYCRRKGSLNNSIQDVLHNEPSWFTLVTFIAHADSKKIERQFDTRQHSSQSTFQNGDENETHAHISGDYHHISFL